jgi:hypothetical protein
MSQADIWEQIQLKNAGRGDNFIFFYIVMALYVGISFLLIFYSCYFSNIKERIKLFLMVDNILITMIGTDVAYAAMHIICFTTTY